MPGSLAGDVPFDLGSHLNNLGFISQRMFKATSSQASQGLAGTAIFPQRLGPPSARESPWERERVPHIFKQTTANGLGPLGSNKNQDSTWLPGTLRWQKLIQAQGQ